MITLTPTGYQFRLRQVTYWVGDTPPQGRWVPAGRSEAGEPMWKRA